MTQKGGVKSFYSCDMMEETLCMWPEQCPIKNIVLFLLGTSHSDEQQG